ncbi:MAG: non-homologous end-joining DNA ligase [Thermoanaerobaculia bacterium]
MHDPSSAGSSGHALRWDTTVAAKDRKSARRDLRPDRVLFPVTGFTKHDAVDYYLGVADVLLPHVRNRPMSIKRYPGDVTEESFWEKDAPGFTPEWVKTVAVPRRSGKSEIDYIVVADRKTLAWLIDVGGLELHPFLHTVRDLGRPTAVVFDLDPGAGATLLECAGVAVALRAYLDSLELESFAKVSGSKGAQVYVPLNSEATHEQTELFARLVAEEMTRMHPDLVVARMAKRHRARKVFIDYSQNADYKTTVAPYSLRGNREIPLVSLPVAWDELETAVRKGDVEHLEFGPAAALRRVERKGDLFAPVLKKKQDLPERFTEALRKLKETPRQEREEEGE